MADELKSPLISFGVSRPALQTEREFITEGNVSIPTLRYDALVCTEHTVELIKEAYTDKAFNDRERGGYKAPAQRNGDEI